MLLEARGLRRSHGERVLFDGLDLSLEEHETIVLSGPSGSGKTAALRLLGGLDPLEAGEVLLEGRGIETWGGARWRARVCYVLQGGPSLAGTPSELAACIARLRAQREREADSPFELAEQWGVARDAWERQWSALSTGERQRLQLALVVARRPRVLLLDEPTSALDPDARGAVEETLRGMTALWVTHDATQAARIAGRVVEIEG